MAEEKSKAENMKQQYIKAMIAFIVKHFLLGTENLYPEVRHTTI